MIVPNQSASLRSRLKPSFVSIGLSLVMSLVIVVPTQGQVADDPAQRTSADVLEASSDEEWRTLDPENSVYIELSSGVVVMELAPGFAPRHVANVKALVRAGLFDGGAINRSQDNYVVQWGRRSLPEGQSLPEGIQSRLPLEAEVTNLSRDFTPLPDGDVYAPEAGFLQGFPAGRDPESGTTWMAHCYGVVGVARSNDPGSGSGAALYVVIGNAPRHLDRNLTMVGRVVSGMEHLSTIPRGTAALGRYESQSDWVSFAQVRMGTEVPRAERLDREFLRTDSQSFQDLILAARSRHEAFFVHPTDRIGLCNVPLPSRPSSGH